MNRILIKQKMLLFFIAGILFSGIPALSTISHYSTQCIIAYADEDDEGGDGTIHTEAAEEGSINGSSGLGGSGNAAEDLNGTIDTLTTILASAGGIILAFGLGSMFLAFKDDNPDAKARATTVIMAAILLITINSVLTHLGVFSAP